MSLLWKPFHACTNDIRKPPSLSGKFSCWCIKLLHVLCAVHVYFPIINFRGQMKLSNNKSCFVVFLNLKFYCCIYAIFARSCKSQLRSVPNSLTVKAVLGMAIPCAGGALWSRGVLGCPSATMLLRP